MHTGNHFRGQSQKALQISIRNTAGSLLHAIGSLHLAETGISAYNQRYIGQYTTDAETSLQSFSFLLSKALSGRNHVHKPFVFVDFGGGSGIVSFLAKALGIERVIYVDIYDVSCRDAGLLGEKLGLKPDAILCGGMPELLEYLRNTGSEIDAFCSFDVIEHIYDIREFFRQLGQLPGNNLKILLTSGANDRNPRIRKRLMKAQEKAEYTNRTAEWGHKERDSVHSFLDIRRNMIRSLEPQLSGEEMEHLARLTRGLNSNDIEASVREYMEKGEIAYRPSHPTNTCDPFTGNWSERLMDQSVLKEWLREENFQVEVRSGNYGESGSGWRLLVKILANRLISVSGSVGLILAPYYILEARKITSRLILSG